MNTIKADFNQSTNTFTTAGVSHELYKDAGPYEYLLGALSGCLYKTFEDIARKMRLTYTSMHMEITAEKRQEIPTTMKTCHISIKVEGSSNNEKIQSAMEKATRYCSIFYTLSQVAQISWSIEF